MHTLVKEAKDSAYVAIQLQYLMARKLQDAILPARPLGKNERVRLHLTFCELHSVFARVAWPWLLIVGRYSFFLCAFFAGALAKTIGSEVIKRFRAKTAGDH